MIASSSFPHRICAPHGNSLCSAIFGGDYVLLNTTDQELQAEVDRSVTRLDNFLNSTKTLHNASFSEQLSRCVEVAKAMVCHSAFPFCSENPFTTRPVCNRTCELFAPGGVCQKILDLELFPGIAEIMFSNCDRRVHPAGESPECVYVPLEPFSQGKQFFYGWAISGEGGEGLSCIGFKKCCGHLR